MIAAAVFCYLATALLILAAPAPARAEPVTSAELIEDAQSHDGKHVLYRGEVVGEILYRGDHAWITVNDDHYGSRHIRRYQELRGVNTGLGIYCRSEQLDPVEFVGSYGVRGDYLEISGTFFEASREHGGDLCIVADRVSVIRPGEVMREHHLGQEPLILASLAGVSLVLAFLLFRRRARKNSR